MRLNGGFIITIDFSKTYITVTVINRNVKKLQRNFIVYAYFIVFIDYCLETVLLIQYCNITVQAYHSLPPRYRIISQNLEFLQFNIPLTY